MKLQRKTFLVTEKQLQMMDAIMERNGLSTTTEVFRSAITALYEKTFKYGEDPLNNSYDDNPEGLALRAKAKADAKLALKTAEETAKLKPKIDMCENLLGGRVTTNENGFKFCKFTQYSAFGNGDQECSIPLVQVAPLIADTSLFMPDKATVLKRRPELKKIFK